MYSFLSFWICHILVFVLCNEMYWANTTHPEAQMSDLGSNQALASKPKWLMVQDITYSKLDHPFSRVYLCSVPYPRVNNVDSSTSPSSVVYKAHLSLLALCFGSIKEETKRTSPKDWWRPRKTEADANDKAPFTGMTTVYFLVAVFLLKLTKIALAFTQRDMTWRGD